MAGTLSVRAAPGARRLLLLFHGVGATPESMLPLAQALADAMPDATVACVEAALPSDLGAGRQWFSVRGITEDNRPARIEAAWPAFEAAVRHWQAQSGVGVADTVLIGFSQGAIMALASTQRPEAVAGRVVAIAGRFARKPGAPPAGTVIHFVHGDADPVIDPAHSVQAAEVLGALGSSVTLDVVPGLSHGIDGRVVARILDRLGAAAPVR